MPRGPQKRSETTRAALVHAARQLFAEHGYAAVTAADLVAAAGLTRGALHHHFGDKQGVFRVVLGHVEGELTDEIVAATAAQSSVEAKMFAAMGTFLDACTRPEVVRIALMDAPAVLGWYEWRAIEADHGLKVITDLLDEGMASGVIARQPVDALAKILLSCLVEAALLIAHADDRAATREQAQRALGTLLAGLLVQPVP